MKRWFLVAQKSAAQSALGNPPASPGASSGFPFCVTDWSKIERTEHKGATGTSFWRTLNVGDVRVRIMEYAPGYLTGYWCSKGHVFFCLEGELQVELEDGLKLRASRRA